jgi:predicted TIM-barrel fold metal-dependent hydrolase
VIALRPGPAYGRSPADPYFDPFWARLNEAHGSVALHLTESGYNRSVSCLWGENPEPTNLEMSAWQWLNCYGDRPIMETLSSYIYANFFERFPNIQIASVENGAGWVPYLLPLMDKMRGMARNGWWMCGQLKERPSQIFKRHVVVTPFPEDDTLKIIDAVGPDSIVLGSDFPHPEGFAEPLMFADEIASLDYDVRRKIMRDNGLRLVRG